MEKIKGPKIDMTLAVPTLAVTLAVALCLITVSLRVALSFSPTSAKRQLHNFTLNYR